MSWLPSPPSFFHPRNVYFLRQQIIHEPPPPAVEESSVGAAPSLLGLLHDMMHEKKSRLREFSSTIVQSHPLTPLGFNNSSAQMGVNSLKKNIRIPTFGLFFLIYFILEF